MPTVICSCGKRMVVSNALIGKNVRCSACGSPVRVEGTPQAAGQAPARKKLEGPGIYVSPGKVIAVVVFAVVAIGIMAFYYGPVRVWHQWEDQGPKASEQITDVVGFALKAYMSTNGMYNPRKPVHAPGLDSDPSFERPFLVMTMPKKVRFFGKSNQGDYSGYYDTQTGEITANVAYGGRTVAGLVNLVNASGAFSIAGRIGPDGNPQAEEIDKNGNASPLKTLIPPIDPNEP